MDDGLWITPQSGRIGNYPISGAAIEMWSEIERLQLQQYIAELEVKGYTVIPSELAAPPQFNGRLLTAVLATAKRRHGVDLSHDMQSDETRDDLKMPFGLALTYALFEDPVFQEALLNPVALAFITYMLGKNALLSDFAILLKGPGGSDLPLHSDSFRIPDPLPPSNQICNITWALTDYTRENGAIAVVPGSHRYCRRPLINEGETERIPVEAKAGSLIVFGGHLWHGAFRRTTPGFRAAITMYMCRPHLKTQGEYGRVVKQEFIDRHPPRFATLMGRKVDYGWREEGPPQGGDFSDSHAMGAHVWD